MAGALSTHRRYESLEKALLNIFFTDTIGSCHVKNAVEFLRPLPDEKIGPVLRLVRLIACSVSDLLAFSFMENVEKALSFLNVEQLEPWVSGALSIYESQGLHPAREYLANPQETALRYGGKMHVATLEEASLGLQMLACGLSGENVHFKHGAPPSTDTETIWLPGSFSLFETMEQNRLFYRVAALHKCAEIRYNSFLCPIVRVADVFPEPCGPLCQNDSPAVVLLLNVLKERFPHTDIEALFCLLDSIRIDSRLTEQFNGIGRDLDTIKKLLLCKRQKDAQEINSHTGEIIRFILYGCTHEHLISDPVIRRLVHGLKDSGSGVADTFRLMQELLSRGPVETALSERLLPYIGTVDLGALDVKIRQRRKALEQNFVEVLGTIVAKAVKNNKRGRRVDEETGERTIEPVFNLEEINQAMAMIIRGMEKDEKEGPVQETVSHLRLRGGEELLGKLAGIAREIVQDLGQIPSLYVSSALDLATGLYDPSLTIQTMSGSTPAFSFHHYPEWDFRRSNYRQDWCTIKEMAAKASSGSFVKDVLKKYKGQVEAIKRQFEMIRQDYNVVKRQKDGQEVDIDAFVEAYTDLKAGLSPCENLYRRLVQNSRDIAVLFLVDMSASTEGWINRAIKESLVLLSTAMECVGDQYSIFGFSGMRRTGCQYFIIKDFQEEFSAGVKSRITGIRPKDYTRMGPAIRHSTKKLKEVEARVKILLTLSDGKPEDYDEYKGPYAIEDTRMALIEARQRGIKPFCITIDKAARQYLPRMYGTANFVLVPEVKILHKRIPEIYRVLTT